MEWRVGMGYDVHPYETGRPCIVGGIKIDHPVGPKGHSDADVLLHAVCDALLGALALGDLGDHFPDTDARYKNADSQVLLKDCLKMATEKGFQVNNLDTVIVCEAPKIKPHREAIRVLLSQNLNIALDRVSVKATTEEKMGYTGRGEGIKAYAYVSLVKPA